MGNDNEGHTMNDNERLQLIVRVFIDAMRAFDVNYEMDVDEFINDLRPTLTNVDLSTERRAFRMSYYDECMVVVFAFFDDDNRMTHSLASVADEPYIMIHPTIDGINND